MKNYLLAESIAIISLLAPVGAFGQGTLAPPGAPAPTMKSLDQVEARTIVNAANTPGDASSTFIISQPGSYYLTGNITGGAGKHGISIQADDVTLDLNGFALISGGSGTVRGINVPAARTNLCIRNGSVRGWNDGGVRADAAAGVLEKLQVANNTGSYGVAAGNGSIIRDCVATANGTGFYAPDRTQVSNCISTVNTGPGIFGTSYVNVFDCTVSRNGGVGIQLAGGNNNVARCSVTRNDLGGITETGGGSAVTECNVGFNPANGIAVSAGSTVRGCTVHANTQKGITATDRCQLIGNTCEGNQTGIEVTGTDNRIDENQSAAFSSGAVGFHIGGSGNVVVRNTAHGPLHAVSPGVFVVDTAYVFDNSNSNSFGPIFGNASGQISSNSPWANFQNF